MACPFAGRPARNRSTAEPERTGVGPFLKRWTIPIIGGLTPRAHRGEHRSVHRQEPARVPDDDLDPRLRQRIDAQLLGRFEHLPDAAAAPPGPPDRARAQPGGRAGRGHGGDHHRRVPDSPVLLPRAQGLRPSAQRAHLLHRRAVSSRADPAAGSISSWRSQGPERRRRDLSTVVGLPPPGGTPTPPTSASINQPIPRR